MDVFQGNSKTPPLPEEIDMSPLKPSKFGMWSVVVASINVLIMGFILYMFWSTGYFSRDEHVVDVHEMIRGDWSEWGASAMINGVVFIGVIGVVLSLVGMSEKNTRKNVVWTGLVINGLLLLMLFVLMAMGVLPNIGVQPEGTPFAF